jgi:hypothetical protein
MSIVIMGSACTSQPKVDEVDYSAWTVETLEDNLRTLQAQEISAANQRATTQADFEKLQEEYQFASDRDKPEKAVLLSEAAADHLAAQQQHMDVKRELLQVRRAYIRKLLLAKQPVVAEEGTARVVGAETQGETVGTWELTRPPGESESQ